MKRHLLSFCRLFFIAAITLLRSEAAPAVLSEPAAAPPGKSQKQKLHSIEQTPDDLAAGEWESIRAAYEAGRHAFHPVDGGWQARNPEQGWTLQFDQRGFLAQPDEGAWTWGLELVSYGFGDAQTTVSGTSASASAVDGQRLTCQRDAAVQEWFVNDQRGLEHGFTILQRPASGADKAPSEKPSSPRLAFLISTRGTLVPAVAAGAQGVVFRDAAGSAVLNYTGLKVWDADGKVLPSHFESAGKSAVRLVVDERGARYPVTVDPIAQQAYLKAGNTGAGDNFGVSVAISGDTVVVGADNEDGSAKGVNGVSNEGASGSGAAYVFVRSGAGWSQQAYLKASNTTHSVYFGRSVAISGDTIVVGSHLEASSTTGVNSTPDTNAANAGAAYVFVRSGATWTQQAYLKAGNTGAGDAFGYSVAVSGDTVVVGAYEEDSSSTGVNSLPNESAVDAGAAYVFFRSGGVWAQQAYLKAHNTGASDLFGFRVGVSGDTAVIGAPDESSNATGINGDGNNNSAQWAGAAYIFSRNGSAWTQQAYLKGSNTGAFDHFGVSVAVSGDTVAAGAYGEWSGTTGVNSVPDEGASNAGAAYVFTRTGSVWSQQAYLKAGNTGREDRFGNAVAVSGDTVVVGAFEEDSSTTGINSTANENAANAGAAYVFVRSGGSWAQQAYLKASNPATSDDYGCSVAVSGNTVVIGAQREDSATTGVNSTPNEGADNAGAAYVFAGAGIRGVNGVLKVPLTVIAGVDLGVATRPPLFPQIFETAWILGGGGSNAGEEPAKAVDENVSTFYGNLGGVDSGLFFIASSFNQITFYTRGNSLDADPVQYTLYLHSPAPDATVPPSCLASTSAFLASGTLTPPSNAPGVLTVSVPPVPGTTGYIVTFPNLRGPSKSKMQISEISLERTPPRWAVPAISAKPGNIFAVQGIGLQSFQYTFYKNENLSLAGWIPLGDVTADASGNLLFNDPKGAAPRKFYRILEKGVSIAP